MVVRNSALGAAVCDVIREAWLKSDEYELRRGWNPWYVFWRDVAHA
jgi:hypothetical protein